MSNTKSMKRANFGTTTNVALTDPQLRSLAEQLLDKNSPNYLAIVEIVGKIADSIESLAGFEAVLTFTDGATRTVNTIRVDLTTGKAGGQSVVGGTGAAENLTWSSTAHATKGRHIIGDSAINEATNIWGIGTTSPTLNKLNIVDTVLAGSAALSGALINLVQTWNTTGTPSAIKVDVTNTASTFGRLLDLRVSSTPLLTVAALNGAVYFGDLLSSGAALGAAHPTTSGFLANGTALSLAHRLGGATQGYGINVIALTGTRQPTSNDSGALRLIDTFNPTSGTSTYSTIIIVTVINQTGGANGIARGIYINPTLTAAADWRSIDIANNAGYAIYQSGASASNHFAGNIAAHGNIVASGATSMITLKGFTVGTLPVAPLEGSTTYVTDADTPTYLAAVVGGGAVKCPVFFDGTTWVCH